VCLPHPHHPARPCGQCIRRLLDVVILLCFLLTIYAIAGLHMFKGAMHYQCFDSYGVLDPGVGAVGNSYDPYCSPGGEGNSCDPGFYCLPNG
jgi:hypothetical protein